MHHTTDSDHVMSQRSRSLTAALAAAGAALAAAACSHSIDPGAAPTTLTELPRSLTGAEQRVLGAANDFTFALFHQLTDAQRGKNVFVSPLSVSMALGMTMNGAAGTTFDQMRAALAFGTASPQEINAGYEGLIGLLRGLDRAVDFKIANSIWHEQTFPFHQSFFDAVRGPFGAEVRGLDFTSPSAVSTINSWVNAQTNGKIPTILDEIPEDARMYLINAIYFKGSWRQRFDPAKTQTAEFTTAAGAKQPVSLMHSQHSMRYLETPELQAVDLAYGSDAFAMTIILPKPGKDVEALAASLGREQWDGWIAQFHQAEVDLYLPKLKLAYERALNDDLQALGMRQAFVPGSADFTRMSPRGADLFISLVKHKAYVDVHEEGTEAAAVTSVEIRVVSAPVVPTMRVDRPYLFAIRERLSGTILFIGKIVAVPS
jgi:serine protease inhibitor